MFSCWWFHWFVVVSKFRGCSRYRDWPHPPKSNSLFAHSSWTVISRCNLELARGANHHVSHVMIDDRILPRPGDDRVEHYALARRDRIRGNSAESMFRVTVGVNSG